MSVSIRPAEYDDLPAISRIRTAAWRTAYAGIFPSALLDGLSAADDLAERRAYWTGDGPGEWLVAVRDGGVVGFAAIGPGRREHRWPPPPESTDGEIYAMYVDPVVAGQGTGRALMTAALDRLAARGLAPVRLWVLAGNHRARRFYAAAGFAADGAEQLFDRDGFVAWEVRYARTAG